MPETRRSFLAKVAQTGGYAAAFSAMQALGLMAQSEPAQFAGCRDSGKGKRVVILGAGIAGMVAAYELRKAGFECTLLEARERPGGRNWTIRNGSQCRVYRWSSATLRLAGGLYLNAGPARIPSIHRMMLGYCEEFGSSARSRDQYFAIRVDAVGRLKWRPPGRTEASHLRHKGSSGRTFSKAIHQGSLGRAADQGRWQNGCLPF